MPPKRVLVVHNAYQQRGGEDAVVEAELELLREHGHEVTELRRHNDELLQMSRLDAATRTLWSRETYAQLLQHLRHERPEVVHVHNSFPLISPSLFWACSRMNVPVVQTLHNFRLACPQAMFLRDGRVCEDCLGRAPWPAVQHGCYRSSRAQTAVVAGMLVLHRRLGTWRDRVTRYIALNEFCRAKFIAAGLSAERIVVKPHFVQSPAAQTAQPRTGLLFVGRLSAEKGIATLARAWPRVDTPCSLRVVGAGDEAAQLGGLDHATLLGAQPAATVAAEMAAAQALVLPSLCYENFPRTLVEAYASGLPVIASRSGALAELVHEGETGLLFTPGDAADLARAMQWALAHPDAMATMGRHARRMYEQRYTPARNHAQLMTIYDDAIAAHASALVPA